MILKFERMDTPDTNWAWWKIKRNKDENIGTISNYGSKGYTYCLNLNPHTLLSTNETQQVADMMSVIFKMPRSKKFKAK